MDTIQKANLLKEKIIAHNNRVAVQEAMYAQFIVKLQDMGLTPETLESEKQNVLTQIDQAQRELEVIMSDIEKELQNGS